ncbi:unnamed protein product [Ceutorhynchus assimilis]|uniref:Protein croquemort n=1 Tax=Ceutorhynchus assimilis TaxID=467358 RepID=A0A9N9MK84_9CUCU|nr:unnamed protein product [Ceutorhynchus assimilis]
MAWFKCCGPKCQKWSTLIVAAVVLVFGVILATIWEKQFQKILDHQLSVSDEQTKGYKMWKETPIPMYLEFHMFNWTNAHLATKNPGVKPMFTEMGPYTFYEHHIRENVTFNDNDTITYMNKRTWRFEPTMSNGTLDDVITMLNPIAIVVTNMIKDEHYLVKRAVNFFLEEKQETLAVKKTIQQVLFEGYDDVLIDIAIKLNISTFNLPFTKFGWFVDRNNSVTYDGVFNMYSGGKNIALLGLIHEWNYQHKTPYYNGSCGLVNGSSGELWWAPHDDETVSIFAPDLCSDVKMHRNGTETLYGVVGNRYVAQADVFDNGTYSEENRCFASGVRTGVRDVSLCKFNAPAYMSLPHFNLADPYYRHEVDGMEPDPELHGAQLSLEPNTGLPLRVHAAFQLNLLMTKMDGIDMFANIKTTMMPCFWFVQKAELDKDLASLAKLMLNGGPAGTYTGYGLIGIGALLVIVFGVVTYRKGWESKDEQSLLKNEDQ